MLVLPEGIAQVKFQPPEFFFQLPRQLGEGFQRRKAISAEAGRYHTEAVWSDVSFKRYPDILLGHPPKFVRNSDAVVHIFSFFCWQVDCALLLLVALDGATKIPRRIQMEPSQLAPDGLIMSSCPSCRSAPRSHVALSCWTAFEAMEEFS